jgi:hypothetical protein
MLHGELEEVTPKEIGRQFLGQNLDQTEGAKLGRSWFSHGPSQGVETGLELHDLGTDPAKDGRASLLGGRAPDHQTLQVQAQIEGRVKAEGPTQLGHFWRSGPDLLVFFFHSEQATIQRLETDGLPALEVIGKG